MSLLLLLLASLLVSQADVLRATLEVTPEGLRYVRGHRVAGELRDSQGALAVVDSEGGVIATVELPPLQRHRAVITPEGHDVGHHPSRYLKVDLPWPEDAKGIRLGPTTVYPALNAQMPPPDATGVPVLQSGPPDARLDLVIFAEGYQEGDEDRFVQHVDYITDHLSTLEPYSTYIGMFNIWRVFIPSPDEGVDKVEPADGNLVDSPFECFYSCSGISRLICCDEDLILSEVERRAPYADGVLLLVNDEQYGGSGGLIYSTSFTGSSLALQVSAHELGHTLVQLWDEYTYPGLEPEGEYISPNCAPEGETVPWQHWIGDDNPEVGIYSGCSFQSWVRPTPGSCMMNVLQDDYCPVCREHIVRSIYEKLQGGMVVSSSPEVGERVVIGEGEEVTFSVESLGPETGLEYSWTLGDDVIAEGTTAVTLSGCADVDDRLVLTLHDPTEWVRSDPRLLLTEAVSWPVRIPSCEAKAWGCNTNNSGSGPGALVFGLLAMLRRRGER